MPGWFEGLAGGDQVLAMMAVAVSILLLIALTFAFIAVLLRLRNYRIGIQRGRLEEIWEPLILGVLSGELTAGQVHERIAREDELFFVEYLIRFVKRFMGEERAIARELARPYLPRVAAQIGHRRAEVRARTVQTLVLLALDEYESEIVAALDDDSLVVAMVAARSLASREHARFAGAILSRIHRFVSWNPIYLASMFSSMGSSVVPVLREIFADQQADPLVRRVAADALYGLDDISSAAVAAATASNATDSDLVGASIRLLSRVGGPEHVAIARRALESPDPLIRLRGAEMLGTIGDMADALRLSAAIEDASPWVALASARALANAGGAGLLEAVEASEGPKALLAREILHDVTLLP